MLESLAMMDKNDTQAGAAKIKLRRKISDYARELGFDLCGFSKAKIEDKYLTVFEDWLGAGEQADMSYMEKIEQRRDMQTILPGAASVVVLAVNYNREQEALREGNGRVARYAYGRDYHKVIGKMLKKLEVFICGLGAAAHQATLSSAPGPSPSPEPIHCKSYVDTGPVMERALAEQAGLGQIGKNGCLITREFGSWVFLSEVITTLDLNAPSVHVHTSSTDQSLLPRGKKMSDQARSEVECPLHSSSVPGHGFVPISGLDKGNSASDSDQALDTSFASVSAPHLLPRKIPHVCGNCTKCITACPTGAIIRPGVVDARLCISYLTIENRDKIPPHLAAKIKDTKRIFGCDICQEVCPHNFAKAKLLTSPGLTDTSNENLAGDQLSTKEITKINTAPSPDEAFLARFAGSPVMRTKRTGMTRNLKILE